jgi:predicted nucleotidyltransferase
MMIALRLRSGTDRTFVLIPNPSGKIFYIFVTTIITMTGFNYIPLIVEKLKSTHPEKIILFGSYAYGVPNQFSDIDILVVTAEKNIPKNFSEKGEIYLRVSKTISEIKKEIPVDLIVHTKSMHQKFIEQNSLFSQELLKKGRILYESNNG